jgi:hypothetical protein
MPGLWKILQLRKKNLLSAQTGNLMRKVDAIQNLKTTGAQNGNFLETVVAVDVMLDELNQEIGRLPPLEFFFLKTSNLNALLMFSLRRSPSS